MNDINKGITENKLKKLGFKLIYEYDHDQYHTKRYAKGVLFVEFTYEGKKLLHFDLTIKEVNCIPSTFNEIKALTHILGWLEDEDMVGGCTNQDQPNPNLKTTITLHLPSKRL